MEQLTDLKAILHSKCVNIYYWNMRRVMQKNGCVLYLTEEKMSATNQANELRSNMFV